MRIEVDDLSRSAVQVLLRQHLKEMQETSPPESMHALDLEQLRRPEITFYSAWADDALLGFGAIKQLDCDHAEIKSMRTAPTSLRTGVGKALLTHIIEVARERGYLRLSLETGSGGPFVPAQKLYANFGFVLCGPFDQYCEDPNSVFMTKVL